MWRGYGGDGGGHAGGGGGGGGGGFRATTTGGGGGGGRFDAYLMQLDEEEDGVEVLELDDDDCATVSTPPVMLMMNQRQQQQQHGLLLSHQQHGQPPPAPMKARGGVLHRTPNSGGGGTTTTAHYHSSKKKVDIIKPTATAATDSIDTAGDDLKKARQQQQQQQQQQRLTTSNDNTTTVAANPSSFHNNFAHMTQQHPSQFHPTTTAGDETTTRCASGSESLRAVSECLPTPFQRVYADNFTFFNAVQSESFDVIFESSRNAVVAAPTGAGKTVVLELALLRYLSAQLRENGTRFDPPCGALKAIYLAPTRSLVGERARAWSATIGARLGLRVEELSVIDDDPRPVLARLSRADVLLATPERWDALTRHHRDFVGFFGAIGLLLVDEVHLLGERNRGAALEVAIGRLKAISQMPAMCGEPISNLRCVAVSATVPNIQDIAAWLSQNGDSICSDNDKHGTSSATNAGSGVPAIVRVYGSEYRPCPLSIHVHGVPSWKNDFLFEKSLDGHVVDLIRQHAKPGKPTLIFSATRRGCATAADQIAQSASTLFSAMQQQHSAPTGGGGGGRGGSAARAPVMLAKPGGRGGRGGGGGRGGALVARGGGGGGVASSSAVPTFAPAIQQALQAASQSVSDRKLAQLLLRGLGYHYAKGMSDGDRGVVEALFRSGYLPCLCCTTTLALGVNLPASCVIIKGTERYDADTHTYSSYATSEVLQMSGRAGRPGFDTSGTAVVLTKDTSAERYRNLLDGGEILESSLHRAVAEHLNAEAHLGTVQNAADAMTWMRGSFLMVRARRNPSFYFTSSELRTSTPDACLDRLVRCSLERLVRGGLVLPKNAESPLEAFDSTQVGRLAAKFCIKIETAEHFLHNMRPNACLADILRALSSAREIVDLVPLRRSEKKDLNAIHNDTLACFYAVTEFAQWETTEQQKQQQSSLIRHATAAAASTSSSVAAAGDGAAADGQEREQDDEDAAAAPLPKTPSREKASKLLRTSVDKAQVLINHSLSWCPRTLADSTLRQEADAVLASADRLLSFAFEACVSTPNRFAYVANVFLLRRACLHRIWHRPAAACLIRRGALGPRSPAGGATAAVTIADFLATRAPECRQLAGIGPKLSQGLVDAGYGPLDHLVAANARDIDAACGKAYPFGYRLQQEARKKLPPACHMTLLENKDDTTTMTTSAPSITIEITLSSSDSSIGEGEESTSSSNHAHRALLIMGNRDTDALLYHARVTLQRSALPHRVLVPLPQSTSSSDLIAALLPEDIVCAARDVYAVCSSGGTDELAQQEENKQKDEPEAKRAKK